MIAPTLLIGLGGTGSKIVCRVAGLVSEEQRQRIGFAVFDTDINELRDIKEANPFVKTIQTSTKLSVGEYLNIDTHARDTWFPVNAILNGKALTEGAGQVRAISRLALETSIRAGKMEPLHEAIQDLYKLEEGKEEQALRVIIVSSLAGGTGSGLILPVALYVKHYLKTHFRQDTNITRGFFILPEVFDEVIRGQAERNNLRSNAYATLRELDAFLMKGDNTLPEKYRNSVKIEFPCVGTNGFEEYDVRPYDFCFLFDAQNSEGNKLNSFNQYLDHAANCIYAQSIGPMNKRSNSSEDNTIRKLCEEKGRNRYAGAGSSMLIYPFEDVKEYIALQWAKECVSSQWLVFDKMYKALLKENAVRRSKGYPVADISAAAKYVDMVEQMAKDKNPFAMSIINACTIFKADGITKSDIAPWKHYADALQKKIQQDLNEGQGAMREQKRTASMQIADLQEKNRKRTGDDYVATFEQCEKYKNMAFKYSADLAPTIAYTIFQAPNDSITSNKLNYQLETYLRDSEGNFIHPNAVRYFLYKTLSLMKEISISVSDKTRKLEREINDFSKNHFDNPETEEEETIDSVLAGKKPSLATKITGMPSADLEQLTQDFSKYLSDVDGYYFNYTFLAVVKEGIEYITRLSDAFQSFYLSFETKIDSIGKRLNKIVKKYEHAKGETARYVCASQTCLDKMMDEMPYAGAVNTIDSELSVEIYDRVRKYAMLANKPDNSNYFGDIFESGIIGYFKKSLMRTYGDRIDVDILTAIENEVLYEQNEYESHRVEQYVRRTIRSTRELSNPFIERPLGEQKDPIFACTFNPNLIPEERTARTELINEELKNAGGVEDKDIPKNMILFYQSFYGLRANDLSKFAPPVDSLTSKRNGGEYYKAYFDLIENIYPESHKSPAITPHIDRWWHIVTKMPDLDEGNQEMQEKDIYAAFFWGIIGDYVSLYDVGEEQKKYRLNVDALDLPEGCDTLVVSNGTPCDRLYEVLDSMAIYPKLVQKILTRINYLINEEVAEDCEVATGQGMLNIFLNNFRVREFPLTEENRVRSIFDIPMLMKRSITPDLYYEEDVLNILKIEIAEIRRYLEYFCTDKELPEVMGNILMEQFNKYLEDIVLEGKKAEKVYHDYLFKRTCTIISKTLEGLGLKQKMRLVEEKMRHLTE